MTTVIDPPDAEATTGASEETARHIDRDAHGR